MHAPTPPLEPMQPIYSESVADLGVPGVVVIVDPDEAEAMGAFEEQALTEAEAWEGTDGE